MVTEKVTGDVERAKPLSLRNLLTGSGPDSRLTYEVDPDFLEHSRREACERPELPWDD